MTATREELLQALAALEGTETPGIASAPKDWWAGRDPFSDRYKPNPAIGGLRFCAMQGLTADGKVDKASARCGKPSEVQTPKVKTFDNGVIGWQEKGHCSTHKAAGKAAYAARRAAWEATPKGQAWLATRAQITEVLAAEQEAGSVAIEQETRAKRRKTAGPNQTTKPVVAPVATTDMASLVRNVTDFVQSGETMADAVRMVAKLASVAPETVKAALLA